MPIHSTDRHFGANKLSVAHPVPTDNAAACLDEKMLSSPQMESPAVENWVKIPDLFTSIMSEEPIVNEFYMASKVASDEWLRG